MAGCNVGKHGINFSLSDVPTIQSENEIQFIKLYSGG